MDSLDGFEDVPYDASITTEPGLASIMAPATEVTWLPSKAQTVDPLRAVM